MSAFRSALKRLFARDRSTPNQPRGHVTTLGISMVKNEQDIVEPFVRHNIQMLDYLAILDNGSVDRTYEILLELSREFPNVFVTSDPAFDYKQSERMTRMLHACQSAFFADFILPLDADEFLMPPDRASFRDVLETIPAGNFGRIRWKNYVLTPFDATAALDPPRSMRWRRRSENPENRKAVMRLNGAFDSDLVLVQGNHRFQSRSGRPVPFVHLEDVELAHYPVRSADQFAAKAICGWMAYLASDSDQRKMNFGHQWREAFEKIVSGAELSPDRIAKASFLYAQHPCAIDWAEDAVEDAGPFSYERRFSNGAPQSALQVVASAWARSLSPRPSSASSVAGGGALGLRPREPEAGRDDEVQGTEFSAAWHWQHLFVDVPPFQFVAERFQPRSVLDMGCGVGAYLKLFEEHGAEVLLGIDGFPSGATALRPEQYRRRDLSGGIDLERKFDLTLCVEVAEHLTPGSENALLDAIARHSTKTIVFSAAEPGQPGHGHINCRPLDYWLAAWSRRGWAPDLASTLGMRALSSFSWFRRNLLVLRPRVGDNDSGFEALKQIAGRKYVWYGQQPGIRTVPFAEPAPPDAGYVAEDAYSPRNAK